MKDKSKLKDMLQEDAGRTSSPRSSAPSSAPPSGPPSRPPTAAPKGWDESVWGLGKLFLSGGKYLGAPFLPSEFSTAAALHEVYYRDSFMQQDGWMWLAARTIVMFWNNEADEDMGPWLDQYARVFPSLLDSITVRQSMVEKAHEIMKTRREALDGGWYHVEILPGKVRPSMVVDEDDYLAFKAGDMSKAPREGK